MKNILLLVAVFFTVTTFQSCDKATASTNEASVLSTSLKDGKTSISQAYKIGDKVEDFSLKNIDGKMISMASYPDAEGYIIVFTCNTCPYAKMTEERIKSLHTKYANNGWPLIAINPNDPEVQPGDSYKEMQKYAAEKGFKFPYLLDVGQEVYPKWGAARTPHVFIVKNSKDTKTLEYIGAVDDNTRDASKATINYVDNTIEAIRAGNTVEPNFTKAIGCSIKTK